MPCYAVPLPGEVRVAMARVGRVDPDSIDSAIESGAYQALGTGAGGDPAACWTRSIARACAAAAGPVSPPAASGGWSPQADRPREIRRLQRRRVGAGDVQGPRPDGGRPPPAARRAGPGRLRRRRRQGVIYVRGEYEWVAAGCERAVAQAEERGWLGDDIRGSGFSFRVQVHRGAGAYICGEETALLESLEGGARRAALSARRTRPRTASRQADGRQQRRDALPRPGDLARGARTGTASLWAPPPAPGPSCSPSPAASTARGCSRPRWASPCGRSSSSSAAGCAAAPVQGGPGRRGGGTFVPAALLDVPIDFSSGKQGVPLGSGAMLVVDESVPVPALLSWLLHFFEAESCGKCTPCREGTREARLIGRAARRGQGRARTAELERLARLMNLTSLCGLGQSVAGPVESALRHFGDEFAAGRVLVTSRGIGPMPRVTIDGRTVDVPGGPHGPGGGPGRGHHHPDAVLPQGPLAGRLVPAVPGRGRGAARPGGRLHQPASDGMVVRTETPALAESRRFVLEMLLRRYADAGYATGDRDETEFEHWVRRYGARLPDGRPAGRALAVDSDPNPFVWVDLNKCILCTRCVRACEEVQGRFVWGVGYRGDDAKLVAGAGHHLLDARCESCGACVAYCPTGALDDKMSVGLGQPDKVVIHDLPLLRRRLQLRPERQGRPDHPRHVQPGGAGQRHGAVRQGAVRVRLRPPPGPADQASGPPYLLDGGTKRPASGTGVGVGRGRLGHGPGPRRREAGGGQARSGAGRGRRPRLGQVYERGELPDAEVCPAGGRHAQRRPLRPPVPRLDRGRPDDGLRLRAP